MKNLMFAIKALSPLHCGIGSGMNDIDLPVARHKVSGHPVIPGSSIKGVLKDEFQTVLKPVAENADTIVEAMFGGNGKAGNFFASAISIGDAMLIALPVRSFFGTFAYLASPFTLQQCKRIMERCNPGQELPKIPTQLGLEKDADCYRAMVTKSTLLKGPKDLVLLEEMDLIIDPADAGDWAACLADIYCSSDEEKSLFMQRFAVVDDNVLNFLCDTALPVDAHIRIDEETGTVAQGALWYEETVPPETMFMSLVGMDRSFRDGTDLSAEALTDALLASNRSERNIFTQMGGKATTGKGFVAVRMLRGGANA